MINMFVKEKDRKDFFEKLAYKTQHAVGLEFGLDKHFKEKKQLVNNVSKYYEYMKKHPDMFGLTPETVDIVAKGRAERRVSPPAVDKALEAMNSKMPLLELTKRISERGAKIMDFKLGEISKSQKKMRETSMADIQKLAIIVGTMYDKSALMRGDATEHISIHAKVDSNLTPEELIALVHKERESNFVKNTQG